MAIGDDENDPLSVVRRMQQGGSPYTGRSNFPAVNQMARPNRNTAFATNAPINTIQQNLNQIPIGGFGLGALQGAGYSRSPSFSFSNFSNLAQQTGPTAISPQSGLTLPEMLKATPSGYNLSNAAGGSYLYQPAQPLAPTRYTLPGVNADVRALSDPSVGALENASRSVNAYGQNVINPAGGGQIISGTGGPNFGSLYGSTQSVNAKGQQVLNTPSGGQAIGGPSLRKPQKMTAGQTYSLGGWY